MISPQLNGSNATEPGQLYLMWADTAICLSVLVKKNYDKVK